MNRKDALKVLQNLQDVPFIIKGEKIITGGYIISKLEDEEDENNFQTSNKSEALNR